MTDSPCSVPDILRRVFPPEPEAVQSACRIHDLAYEQGGSRLDRLRADCIFALAMIAAGFEHTEVYFSGVRAFGESHFNKIGPSWSDLAPETFEAP